MASLKDCIGEGLIAGVASRLTTEEKAKQVAIGLSKLSLMQREKIQEELYERIKSSKVKNALARYMDFINYQK